MPQDTSDKPSWTIQFDTGMAMTLSCAPPRRAEPAPKPAAPPAAEPSGAGKPR